MIRILEVCTVSSAAFALVFPRVMALKNRGEGLYDIDLLCSDGKEVALMQQAGLNPIIAELHRSLNPLSLLSSIRNLLQVIRQQRYDVIHLHFGIPSLVGRLLAVFIRRPIWIYQSHGYSIAHHTSALEKTLYLGVERLLRQTVDYALFQSHEDIDIAKQHRLIAPEKIIYLGNGINTARFIPSNQPTQHYDLTVFGMVARFEPIKNHQLLINAVKHLRLRTPKFKVYLIGQGELLECIQAQIAAHQLESWIEVLPHSHDMPAFYQTIDVGILTSFGEGLPRALLEPMACGKAVICTDVKGSREAVTDGKQGFVVPLNDPPLLAERMEWCIKHPDQVRYMGRVARCHVLTHFDEQQVLDRLHQLYQCCAQTISTTKPALPTPLPEKLDS